MGNFRVLAMITPMSYLRVGGVVRFAEENGWMLTINERLYGVEPSTANYDGVLVTLREKSREIKYIRRMKRRGTPIVDLTIEMPGFSVPRVISDHREIGKTAGRHFHERGFRNTAWFSSGWTHVHDLRFRGLASVVETPPHRIVSNDDAEITRAVAGLPKPVAVLTYDEPDAVRILNLCRLANLSIPDDVAILSIGDDPLFTRNQEVPLSAVNLNPARAGYAAAALLHRLMSGGKPPEKPILIRPNGVFARKSTDTLASDDPTVRKALLFIRDNLSRPFGAEQVSDALAVSRSMLDKKFTAVLGHSIGREICRQKMREAERRLEKTDDKVAVIAQELGFCSAAYFVKRFRDEHGMTPHRFRAQALSKGASFQRLPV